MFKTSLENGSYFDFILTNDCRSFNRDINQNKLFYIDVTNNLCTITGTTQTTGVTLNNITLTGYDNFYLKPGETTKTINSGSTFCLHEVSGYTENLKYEIVPNVNYNELNGGFYQGFFKLHNYPVEFIANRMRKGWTVNMLLHFPITGTTTGQTLNNIFSNPGFIFYLGTRAENKFINLTNVEVSGLTTNYGFTFDDIENQYNDQDYILTGSTYTGYYNIKNGIPYTGRVYDPISSIKLEYNEKYADIINNAFGVRITSDGKIGYRTIYATDPCYTGTTQNVSGITNNSFVDYTRGCDNHTIRKIITKYFTIEESYTKTAVINQNNNKFLLISVTFERDFELKNNCELKYNEYRNGTLSIAINGFNVYKNTSFSEVIPHELDTDYRLQEGVPFNISFGGGTQGLFESLSLDPAKTVNGIIENFFAGTFEGGVKFIEMYSVPLYITEIRNVVENLSTQYNLFYPKGGRRVFIKNLM
jgi:hypothetical protein